MNIHIKNVDFKSLFIDSTGRDVLVSIYKNSN